MNTLCKIICPRIHEGRINYLSNRKSKLDSKITNHSLLIKSASSEIKRLNKRKIRYEKKQREFKDIERINELILNKTAYQLVIEKKKKKLEEVHNDLYRLKRNEKKQANKLSNTENNFHHSCKNIETKIHDEIEHLKEKAGEIKDKVDELFHRQVPDVTASNPPKEIPLENLISVFNAKNKSKLPGTLIYQLNPKVDKNNIIGKQAFDNVLEVLKFWSTELNLRSYDNKNAPIKAVIHYLNKYANAYWDGEEIVFGDGDEIFGPFVNWEDIIGHELGHALIGDDLIYEGETGALNESFADIIGAMVNMYANKIKGKDYHWLVGKDIIRIQVKIKGPNGEKTYHYNTYALRSFKAPGTAFPYLKELGCKDTQPAVYSQIDQSDISDNNGVHDKSGIPNHVFWLIADQFGEEKAFLFWYDILKNVNTNNRIQFAELANLQIETARARKLHDLADALTIAWTKVEVLTDSKIQIIESSLEKHQLEEILIEA
ncbi:MAG: M4 family metallopeptidase [Parachlamydiaceae bacterium]|nr:M4 family metallopeptidase [Parachlamydiaceae bacterium]